MLTKSFIAAGALLSLVAAVPMQKQNKRDIVWETKIENKFVTVDVTTTVWLEPGETAPAAANHYHGHNYGHHHKSKVTSHIKSTVTVPAASPSSPPESAPASTYAAPNPLSSPESPTSQAPAPTSTWQAPAPTSEAPTPTSEAPAPTSAAPAPSAAPSSPSGGSSGGSDGLSGAAAAGKSYTGDFTWYDTGLGACGITSAPSDHIVAVSEDLFDQYDTGNPNNNPLCGLTVDLTGADGSSYPATIVDRCTGCALSDLDLSEDFFNLVTDNGNGRVGGMSWSFA